MVEYKILDTKNPHYNETRITKSCLLYNGGYELMNNAELFLTKLSIESNKSFQERLKCAAYMPYLSQFVDNVSCALFSDDLMVREAADADDQDTMGEATTDDFYKLFSVNCDGLGNSLHNFIKDEFTESLYSYGVCIGVDFKKVDEENKPANLFEEEIMGFGQAYLYDIDPITIIDWKKSPADDKFLWVKLKNEICLQDDPLQPPMKQIEFKIWTMINGLAHWQLYRSRPLKLNEKLRATDDVPLVEEGDTSFREIPVFDLCIPYGLHLGSKLGPICEEYFQRRSFLVSNMNKTCITIPVVKLGPEISAPGEAVPSVTQQNPNRASLLRFQLSDQGYTVIGKDDELKIEEAHGYSHELADKQLIDLREQMHQVVHQMAQSAATNKMATTRSALSKMEDRHAMEILLNAYGRIVKDFVKEIYQCISFARGEKIVWAIHGLSTFVSEDRTTIINEVKAVAGKQSILSLIPSETFHKKYLMRLAVALTGTLTPEEEDSIQEEIEKGVENKEHLQLESGQEVADTGDNIETEKEELEEKDSN